MDRAKEIISELDRLDRLSSSIVDMNEKKAAVNLEYDKTMDRICSQVLSRKRLAKEALSWIVCAKRPLTCQELRTALGIEPGESALDEENQPDIDDIVTSCAGLLIIASDGANEIFQLAHYTIQEYLQRRQEALFPAAHQIITESCLTYLSFEAFELGSCKSPIQYRARLAHYPLYSYAANHWGDHSRSNFAKHDVLISFVRSHAKVEASVQALFAMGRFKDPVYYSQTMQNRFTSLHLAAHFGLADLVHLIREDGGQLYNKASIEQREHVCSVYSSRPSQSTVVEAPLEHEIELSKNNQDGEIISIAASRGHTDVINMLLDSGIDPNLRDNHLETPLMKAATNDRVDAAVLLLARGANPNLTDDFRRSAFTLACIFGSAGTFNILPNDLLDLGHEDEDGKTAVDYAIKAGHIEVLKSLRAYAVQDGKHDHVIRQIDSRLPHRCPLCEEAPLFTSRVFLQRHIYSWHYPSTVWISPDGRRFRRRDNALSHMRVVNRYGVSDTDTLLGMCQTVKPPCPSQCVICQLPTPSRDLFIQCVFNHGLLI